MASLRQDLRFALRTRRRGRVITVLAIVSLALGIAGNAIFFSWLSAFLFRPLPYSDPDRLVLLGERQEGSGSLAMVSMFTGLSTWADYRERSRTLEDWGALNFTLLSLARRDGSVPLFGAWVTPGFFRVLGVEAARGRVFTDADGGEGAPKVAVLSWDYWMDSGGRQSDPLGTVLTLDGEPYEVIGVMPEKFEFLIGTVDVWIPVQGEPYAWPRGRRSFISVARMGPGVTMGRVRDEVAAISTRLEDEHPEALEGWEMRAYHLRTEYPDPQTPLHLATIQGMVFFVLLIACVNVAILLLARGEERRREIALRMALGAGRLRIFGQHVRESMVMAALGGMLGLVLAAAGIRLLEGFLSPTMMPRRFEPRLDGAVVWFTVAVTVLAGLVFGLVPAFQSLRQNQAEALKAGRGAGSRGGGRRGRLSAALVAIEIALCLVALGGGSVLVRTFQSLRLRAPGFDADDLLSVEFVVPHWKHLGADEWTRIMERIEERTERLPHVVSATLVNAPPQSLLVPEDTVRFEGELADPTASAPRAVTLTASPRYLETMGVPLLQGRFFDAADRADAPPVAVVSRSLARDRFGARSPVGERIAVGGKSREIVGVVQDVQQALVPQAGASEGTVYVPLAQGPTVRAFLMLRTDTDPLALVEPVRRTFASIDPDVTIHAAETMDQYARRYTAPLDVINPMLGAFGLFALLLAALGTYGVVAYSVGQRTHEIGVRIAVGARGREVVGMIALAGLTMSVVGLILGTLALIPVVALAGRILEGFALASVEPLTLVAVGAVLFGVTLVASILPARRAARVDPMLVLRTE